MTEFTLPHGDLLVAPESKDWVESLLAKMAEPEFVETFTQKVNLERASNDNFWTEFEGTWFEVLRPYNVTDGVLTIPVKGMLLKGFPFAWAGMLTGYEYVTKAIERGAADPEVNEIVMDINSPGGTVAGCFDCADAIYVARSAKPIRAVANESAYSAAYALASSAHDITVARTGGVGSIGVMSAHVDMTGALEQRGIKVTPIYAGEQKVDGQPFVPLSDEAKARMQERTDALYSIFVSTVARNRGLDEQKVRDTEAGTFMAPVAVEKGLADAVGSLDSLSANADPSNDDEDETMSKENQSVTQADHEAAVEAATEAAMETGTNTGLETGAANERTRIAAILDSEEAKTRPAAARHVALNSDMTTEAAAAFLKGLPEESKAESTPAGGSDFENAMNGTGNPELGAGDGGSGEEMSTSDKIFASAGYDKA